MACDLNHNVSMLMLAHYYNKIEKNFFESMVLLIKGKNLGYVNCIFKLFIIFNKCLNKNNNNGFRFLNNSIMEHDMYEIIKDDRMRIKHYEKMMYENFLILFEMNNTHMIKYCIKNDYFNNKNIKNKITNKIFTKNINKINCPITLMDTRNTYKTICNHEFSNTIFKCVQCPLCRNELVK